MFINEESIEEDQSERSMINEDQERRGEQLSSQNVSPQILWTSDFNAEEQ